MDEKERRSEIQAKLIVRGFECSPGEITKILSIHPTKTWLQGETVSARAKNVHKDNGWLLESPCDPVGSSIDAQIDSLFPIVMPHVEAFANLPTDTKVELLCVMYLRDYREPAIIFPTDIIRTLAQISAGIGISLYDLRELEP